MATMFKKVTLAAVAAITMTAGASMMETNEAQAAAMLNLAPVTATASGTILGETSAVKEVGYRHRGHRRWRHRGYRWGRHYRPYRAHYRDCFWKTRRVWSSYYGYYIKKRVRVCY